MSPLGRLEWLRAVASVPGMIGPPLAVAVALTKYINNDTHDARPSIASLAAQVGLAERTIQKAARSLEAAGLLHVEHPAGRKCCTYTPANPVPLDRVQPRLIGQGSAPSNPVQPDRQPRHVRSQTPSSRSPEQGGTGFEHGCCELALRFALRGGGEWQLPNDLRATLAAAFPDRNLDAELAKAAAWCATEPSRRKTASGMGRFLRGWLNRANPGEAPPAEVCPQPGADALAYAAELEAEIRARESAHV